MEGLVPNAFLCQDKNIDILRGKSGVLDFIVWLGLAPEIQSGAGRVKKKASKKQQVQMGSRESTE
jgi:hypothetical protein